MEGRIVIRNTWQPHTNDGEPPCPLNHGLYFTFKKQTIHYLTEEIPKKITQELQIHKRCGINLLLQEIYSIVCSYGVNLVRKILFTMHLS